MFHAQVWRNKIENNAIKMHFYERFKTGVLGTSQRRHNMDVFSRRFEDVHKTFIPNCKNIQQLTFQYFTQQIWWSKIEINAAIMWLVLYVQNWGPGDVRKTQFCRHHLRTLLGRPWDVSPHFMRKWINSVVVREFFGRALRRSSKIQKL